MNSIERRATGGLALVYALRMMGLFMVLPVFTPYAEDLPGGATPQQIGLALGIYGLTQAVLQIPLGWLSDRIGRKPIILAGMAVFAAGSWLSSSADTIEWLIVGRALQGAGAISSAVSALLADVTRAQVRTQAMTLMGAGMGGAFVLALIIGPPVAGVIGVDGIFAGAGWLALLTLPILIFMVPKAPRLSATRGRVRDVIRDGRLLRIDGGIFLLHAAMTASFLMLPAAIGEAMHLDQAAQWEVYLPVMLLSLFLVFPIIRIAEKHGLQRSAMVGAILALASALLTLGFAEHHPAVLVGALGLFFIGFNYLEGALPSLISRIAPADNKGAALGVYATSQFLGAFVGGAVIGGNAMDWLGMHGFAVVALLPLIWLSFVSGIPVVPRDEAPVEGEPAASQR
ncbi:MFS transporter [Algiphilus sp. W345]|uniref:MFS transporter n=1 Tax=Banduia mediterranea TaxID=3075609 RepID=A0ABU2WGR4_9GAMM|nr:MFS transporter [Algiphilus sp. W345]MDT0496708.1 MFS transporter [Algiphilus sp. W345]